MQKWTVKTNVLILLQSIQLHCQHSITEFYILFLPLQIVDSHFFIPFDGTLEWFFAQPSIIMTEFSQVS